MAKNPGCWANGLDDCSGRLTAEHVLSASVWDVPAGLAKTRENRLRRPLAITMRNAGERSVRREITVKNHTGNILCVEHNRRTSELDAAGGLLAEHIRDLFDVHLDRIKLPGLRWNVRSFDVSGPLIERWLLKVAINTLFRSQARIGGADAEPGWPTLDLLEIVFARRSIDRATDGRFFSVQSEHNVGDRYRMACLERNPGEASTFIMSYGVFHLGVQLESRKPNAGILNAVPHLGDGTIVHPPKAMRMERTNVEVRFLW